MPGANSQPMNPTVEDVQDESEIKTYPRPMPDRSHSWHEVSFLERNTKFIYLTNLLLFFIIQILSRHESVLSAHIEMLKSAQRDACADGDALRIVASMVARTEELMGQFKTITSQFVCFHTCICCFLQALDGMKLKLTVCVRRYMVSFVQLLFLERERAERRLFSYYEGCENLR